LASPKQHLDDAVAPQHDVLRLDVSMHDPQAMRGIQGRSDLRGGVEREREINLCNEELCPGGGKAELRKSHRQFRGLA
jgi:hypothetical protein